MELYNFLTDCILALSILACLLSIWICYKKEVDTNFKILVFILSTSVLVEAVTTLLYHIQDYTGMSNVLWIYNLYYIMAYISWFILFYRLTGCKYKKSLFGIVLLFTSSFVTEALFFLDYTTLNLSIPHVVGALCLTIFIVLYFVQILQDGSFDALKNNLYFWIGSGLLIYYVGSLPFAVVNNFFTFSWSELYKTVDYSFFHIKFSLNIVMYILICIGLYRYKNLST